MEIPYTVTARKDTGLFNAKIGIWLFLASEVMLFGGLFSGYVFLRIYADYPWPERALPVLPGLINTFVLIGSSVTVVFAWASLKMRQWGRFQFFMSITILCAVAFMILKGIEYKAKWNHQAVRLDDFTIIEGHLHKAELDEHGHMHIHEGPGKHEGGFYANKIVVEAEEINLTLTRAHKPYIEDLLAQAGERGATITLVEPMTGKTRPKDAVQTYVPAGEALTAGLIKKARKLFVEARAHNADVRTAELKRLWKEARKTSPDARNYVLAEGIQIDNKLIADQLVSIPAALTFKVEPHVPLLFDRSVIREGDGTSKLKDDTKIIGKVAASPMGLAVDAVDLRFVAQRAIEQNKNPETVIDGLWIMQNPEFKRLWEMHRADVAVLAKSLAEGKEPTETERYRIGWQDLVAYHQAEGKFEPGDPKIKELRPGAMKGFAGPNHNNEEMAAAFFDLQIPNAKVAFESKFTPKWNNYYAIYFTLTGLHGLHVIGGALVLAYYLFCSKGLYRRNPEWLTNRVEIGGLFWHFVDLVWIFLFPILYLM
jgi:heme/copper-type cytochrome/quinol oxidase subunit 3